jgi:MoaA/NifB/PqqE/SkfB family radical SAM enzyme
MVGQYRMTDKMNEVSPTFCALPWSHIYIGPNGKIAPCCIGKNIGTYGKITLEKAWNSEEMKKLRLDMLSGVRNNLCNTCYKKEDIGFKSMRRMNLRDSMYDVEKIVAETNADGSLNDFKLSYLDIRFNNLCNFKCRSCNPYFSSSIAVETIQNPRLDNMTDPRLKGLMQNVGVMSEIETHYPYVTNIYFAGGEPMMQEEHWNILKHLVDSGSAKNVSLIYSTNMSKLTFKNQSIFDYWTHFKHVNIRMSIDAEGNRAEYWRDGTVWEEVFNNIKVTKNIQSIHSGIHSVISWVTIYSYIELIKKMINEFTSHRHDFTIWCLDAPEEYSLQILPDFKKEEIKKALDDFIEYLQNIDKTNYPEVINIINNIENIKIFMYAKSTVITEKTFKKHFMLDKIRNKDFFEYFPEHENMKDYMQ